MLRTLTLPCWRYLSSALASHILPHRGTTRTRWIRKAAGSTTIARGFIKHNGIGCGSFLTTQPPSAAVRADDPGRANFDAIWLAPRHLRRPVYSVGWHNHPHRAMQRQESEQSRPDSPTGHAGSSKKSRTQWNLTLLGLRSRLLLLQRVLAADTLPQPG